MTEERTIEAGAAAAAAGLTGAAAPVEEARGGGLALPALSLCRRELVRFFRQRARVVGALAFPVLLWLFLGLGFGSSFQPPGMPAGTSYLTYAFPGTVLLIVLFTSIFSAISVIEDRKEGFLQGVLVAPVPRPAIVAGKVLGGTAIAMIEALLFLALTPLLGLRLGAAGAAGLLVVLLVTSLGLTATGFFFAWRTDSIQGFHSIMNVVLFPMWLLSGAFFPVESAPLGLRVVMYANPLTHGLSLLRRCLYLGGPGGGVTAGPPPLVSAAVVLAFAGLAFAGSVLATASGQEVQP
jgi:ABC-2 type transport system permease protein